MDSKILGSSPRMTLWVGLAVASKLSPPCPPRRRGPIVRFALLSGWDWIPAFAGNA
jgi:hypothetical protein